MSDADTNAAAPLTNGAGTASADTDPSTDLENSMNWDFADPSDEDEAAVEEQPVEATNEEAEPEGEEPDGEAEQSDADDEAEAGPEVSKEEAEGEGEAEPTTTLKLPSGDEVSLEEAAQGYMRQGDYTRKTQEVAESRRGVEAQAQQLQSTVDAFVEFVSASVTPAPDPSLAYSDPNTYTAMKAQHEAQMAQVQQLMALGQQPKQVSEQIASQASSEDMAAERAKLESAFPSIRTEAGNKAFFDQAFNGARTLGFTDAELAGTHDSRLLTLGYWATKGMEAEKASKAAKRKVAAAPKAAPVKARRTGNNRDAMKKLGQTGSLEDAMNIDFD